MEDEEDYGGHDDCENDDECAVILAVLMEHISFSRLKQQQQQQQGA